MIIAYVWGVQFVLVELPVSTGLGSSQALYCTFTKYTVMHLILQTLFSRRLFQGNRTLQKGLMCYKYIHKKIAFPDAGVSKIVPLISRFHLYYRFH